MAQIETLEDALEEIGGFGKFQLFALIAIIYPELPGGILGMLPVYATRAPEFWNCTTELGETLRLRHEDACSCNGTLESSDFSIVTEWNLVCDYAWVADFITSLFMTGMFLGGFFGSQIADWIGRRKTLYLSCLLTLTSGIAGGLATSAYMYAGTRLVAGFAIASFLVVGAIYPMEFFTPRWRSLSGTLGPWGEGIMLLPVFAMFLTDWRTLSWVSSLPMLLMFIGFPFLPESPRWLLKNNKVEQATKTLNQVARWNGKPPLEEHVVAKLALNMTSGTEGAAADQDEEVPTGKASKSKAQRGGFIQLLTDREAGLKILNFLSIWFSGSLIYYTISYNTKSLSGNINLNMVFQGLIDSVGFRTSPFVMGLLGRKKAIVTYLVLGSLPLVGIVLMELELIQKKKLGVTVLSLVAKFFIAGGWSSIKCFTGESFPTSLRSSAVGICTVAAALGGVLAPQTIFLGTINPAIPYFVLGGLSVFSAFMSFFLQETSGKPISETS